jgi:hypothetical protein
MKKLGLILLVFTAVAMARWIPAAVAQASTSTSMSSWPFFVNVTPQTSAAGTYSFVVPIQVMDKSREDLADLRLYDAGGREIPYALRIRREIDDNREVTANVFNQAAVGSISEVSVDLGEYPGEHNQVEIDTSGRNFRRRVVVEGSDTSKEWRTLKSGEVIFGFEAQNRTAESNRISYPTSRYRYLRVRVVADELTDQEAPIITGVKVMMAIRVKGEQTTWETTVPSYQLLRNQGAPAATWTIDLGGRVPCDRIILEVNDQSFSRPFQLEAVDDPQNSRLLASGELTRRLGEQRRPLVITFDNEEYARKLRLLITDYSNQTLSISSIKAEAPARELIFDLKETDGQPLRLFFGNAKATAPHYDFEKELPARLATTQAPPVRSDVGAVVSNPDYVPEPLPLTERIPWLIYLVLAASSIALALILMSLARTTLRTKLERGEGSEFQDDIGLS